MNSDITFCENSWKILIFENLCLRIFIGIGDNFHDTFRKFCWIFDLWGICKMEKLEEGDFVPLTNCRELFYTKEQLDIPFSPRHNF